MRRTVFWRRLSLAATPLLILAACSSLHNASGNNDAQGGATTAATQAGNQAQAAAGNANSAAVPKSCQEITAEQALEEANPFFQLNGTKPYKPGFGWDQEHYKPFETFAPCLDLSYIHLHQAQGNNDAATFVALFHQGHFATMLRANPVGYVERIEQITPGALKVTFADKQFASEVRPEDRRAVSTYSWDGASQSVKRAGDLIMPEQELPLAAATSTAPTTPSAAPRPASANGAYAGAGGPIPVSATPATAVISLPDGSGDVAMIVTPSGNIGCDLGAKLGMSGCGVESYLKDRPHGEDRMFGPNWWILLDDPQVTVRGDVPNYLSQTVPPQVVEYGQAVYYGDFVCASEEAGLTCWNVRTHHGAFMNRTGTKTF